MLSKGQFALLNGPGVDVRSRPSEDQGHFG